jgi:hypothetical protein
MTPAVARLTLAEFAGAAILVAAVIGSGINAQRADRESDHVHV